MNKMSSESPAASSSDMETDCSFKREDKKLNKSVRFSFPIAQIMGRSSSTPFVSSDEPLASENREGVSSWTSSDVSEDSSNINNENVMEDESDIANFQEFSMKTAPADFDGNIQNTPYDQFASGLLSERHSPIPRRLTSSSTNNASDTSMAQPLQPDSTVVFPNDVSMN